VHSKSINNQMFVLPCFFHWHVPISSEKSKTKSIYFYITSSVPYPLFFGNVSNPKTLEVFLGMVGKVF
jgi:hypothetical protein